MTEQPTAEDERVAAALGTAFPEREIDDVRPAGISWNDQNETVRVDFSDGESVYLKVATDGDGSRIARECAATDYVSAHCDVAVPSIIASDADGDPPYLVTGPMCGRNLADKWGDRSLDERTEIVRQVGTAVAKIHSCSFECHGRIVGGDADDLRLDTGTWTEVLVDIIGELRDLASTDRFEHHFEEVKTAITETPYRVNDAPATLVYGDPAQPNLFRNDTTIGFVDWEIAHVGDPARELDRVEKQFVFEDTERMVQALHDGYRRHAGSLPDGRERRRPIYDVVWHLNRSAVFDKYVASADDPEAVAREHEDTMNELLDELRHPGNDS